MSDRIGNPDVLDLFDVLFASYFQSKTSGLASHQASIRHDGVREMQPDQPEICDPTHLVWSGHHHR
jgi:hypothetical protein